MRIAVFGATGMAGTAIVTEAVTRGHTVTAFSRRASGHASRDRLTYRAVDAAVLAIRLAQGQESRLAPLTHGFLDAAASHRTPVLVVGGSAPLRSPNHPDRLVIDDPHYVPEAWKAVAQASLDQFRVCQDHPHRHCTYLSPPAVFEPGERTGRYRRGTTTLLVDANGYSGIAAADLAVAVIDELETPGTDRHFTVVESKATRR